MQPETTFLSIALPPDLEEAWYPVHSIVLDNVLVVHLPENLSGNFRVHFYSDIEVLGFSKNLFKRSERSNIGRVHNEGLDLRHLAVHAHQLAVNAHVEHYVHPAESGNWGSDNLHYKVDGSIVRVKALEGYINVTFIAKVYVIRIMGLVSNVFVALQYHMVKKWPVRSTRQYGAQNY